MGVRESPTRLPVLRQARHDAVPGAPKVNADEERARRAGRDRVDAERARRDGAASRVHAAKTTPATRPSTMPACA